MQNVTAVEWDGLSNCLSRVSIDTISNQLLVKRNWHGWWHPFPWDSVVVRVVLATIVVLCVWIAVGRINWSVHTHARHGHHTRTFGGSIRTVLC